MVKCVLIVYDYILFQFLGEISRGAFGQVFHVRCATTNKEYAMKVLSKSQVSLSIYEHVSIGSSQKVKER